jgi:S1-C subfamily serine protease
MTSSYRMLLGLVATAGVVGLIGGLALRPRSSSAAGEAKDTLVAPSSLDAIRTFSAGSQELYRKISGSIVHVRLDLRADQLVPDSLQKEYEQYSKDAGQNAGAAPQPGTGPAHRDRDHERDGRGRPGDNAGPTTRPHDFLNARRFMEQRLADNQRLDPDTVYRIRQGIARIDALRQGQGLDLVGVIIDSSGHVLVHAPLIKDADNKKNLHVILSDGSETTASVRGTDFLRGLSVITLESGAKAIPVVLASSPPAAGELLFSVSTSRGNLGWTVASDSVIGRRRHDATFNIGDDRGSSYQFNCNGELVALSREGRATPVSAMTADLQAIVEDKPLPRHVIGVKYSLLGPDSPIRDDHPALGLQPAVVVDDVTAGSPAAKAGLMKGDFIVKIDHKPISQLMRILAELRYGANEVDVDIIRGNDAKTLKLSLERAGTKTTNDK